MSRVLSLRQLEYILCLFGSSRLSRFRLFHAHVCLVRRINRLERRLEMYLKVQINCSRHRELFLHEMRQQSGYNLDKKKSIQQQLTLSTFVQTTVAFLSAISVFTQFYCDVELKIVCLYTHVYTRTSDLNTRVAQDAINIIDTLQLFKTMASNEEYIVITSQTSNSFLL